MGGISWRIGNRLKLIILRGALSAPLNLKSMGLLSLFFCILLYAIYWSLTKQLQSIQAQINSLKKPEMTFEDAKDIVESEGFQLIKK